MLNLTRNLYSTGNAYALAVRNDRFEISELHLMNSNYCTANVAQDGEVYYSLGGNEIVDSMLGVLSSVPARDVLHIRLHTPRHPLRGESPILASAQNLAAGNAALEQQVAFFANQSRPSIVLSTDKDLKPDQVKQIRAAWNEQTLGANSGGTPMLSGGLKPYPITTSAQEAQLAETLKMSDQAVAEVYRIPMQVLGIGETPYASTEMLMSAWKSQGLGFALNHIEEALGRLFRLRGGALEYVEFDTNALLRSSFKERIEALSNGTRRLFTINEARALEGLPAVDGGDEIRVQQQDVPLSAWEKGQTATPAIPAATAEPAPPAPAGIEDNPEDAARNSVDAILERIYAGASLH